MTFYIEKNSYWQCSWFVDKIITTSERPLHRFTGWQKPDHPFASSHRKEFGGYLFYCHSVNISQPVFLE